MISTCFFYICLKITLPPHLIHTFNVGWCHSQCGVVSQSMWGGITVNVGWYEPYSPCGTKAVEVLKTG